MSFRFLIALLFSSITITAGYKSVRHIYDSLEKKLISEQICRASEARLQVGATREVVDVARSALNVSGYPAAEIELKSSGLKFSESKLDSTNALMFKCQPEGIQSVELLIYFPKKQIFTVDVVAVFFVSLVVLWLLKIALVLFVKGLQTDFANEFNKVISKALGVKTKDLEHPPFWMNWLHELNPSAIREFKNRIVALENKIERQAKDIQSQATEKARKELQLIEAKKFKDLVHQVRHDLRQTVGVVRSSLELIPTSVNGRDVLRGAVGSLDSMISDLKEREIKHSISAETQEDLIEVIIAEAVREQQVAFSGESIKIDFLMSNKDLHFTSAPREELKRVITNLIVNAAEAIHVDGKIEILSEVIGNEFTFKVVDNGEGFSEEALKNLFKKGFTTKPDGSGRGLSFAQQKIRQWGGRLLVDSRLGRTVIEVTLPVAKANHWVHPSIISETNDVVFVDDHPLDISKIVSENSKSAVYGSLKAFTHDYKIKKIGLNSLIVFDLHLEEGLLATEMLATLEQGQKYVFMTSDYLNLDLVSEAQKREFLVIPKELVGFALMNGKDLGARVTNIVKAEGV